MINGVIREFSRFDERQTLTEVVDHNFLGYSDKYLDEFGNLVTLSQPAKFYK